MTYIKEVVKMKKEVEVREAKEVKKKNFWVSVCFGIWGLAATVIIVLVGVPLLAFELFKFSPSTLAKIEFYLNQDLLGNGFCRQKNIGIKDGMLVFGDFETPRGRIGKHIMGIEYVGENRENATQYDKTCPDCELIKAHAAIYVAGGEIVKIVHNGNPITTKNVNYIVTAFNLKKGGG